MKIYVKTFESFSNDLKNYNKLNEDNNSSKKNSTEGYQQKWIVRDYEDFCMQFDCENIPGYMDYDTDEELIGMQLNTMVGKYTIEYVDVMGDQDRSYFVIKKWATPGSSMRAYESKRTPNMIKRRKR